MNNYTIFCNVIQKALKEGRFKLANKKGGGMTIDTNPFPSATINMISILAEQAYQERRLILSAYLIF